MIECASEDGFSVCVEKRSDANQTGHRSSWARRTGGGRSRSRSDEGSSDGRRCRSSFRWRDRDLDCGSFGNSGHGGRGIELHDEGVIVGFRVEFIDIFVGVCFFFFFLFLFLFLLLFVGT
jgi:hypothetical protein